MAIYGTKHFWVMLALLTTPCLVGGCSAAYMATKFPKLTAFSDDERKDWTMLRRANYAAADALYQGASNRLTTLHKIKLVQLNNLGTPLPGEGTPAITWLVPQQVGNRMTQLGLPVIQPDKAPPQNASAPAQDANVGLPLQLVNTGAALPVGTKRQAGYIYVEGDYVYLNDELLISLRLIDGRTDQILSTSDYNIDVDSDVLTLIDPTSTDRIFGTGWMH